jgi:SAM-dependent methyltransferase
MELESWLLQNEDQIDWQYFASPWDEMQRRHNPFRDEQLENMLYASDLLQHQAPSVLDLGCGPGAIGSMLSRLHPLAKYHGSDGDPLMLSALRRLLPRFRAHSLKIDLRATEWSSEFHNKFDSVTSLTALHWLPKSDLERLYRVVFSTLRPGGTFVVGDPYCPEDPVERERLQAYQNARIATRSGQTWSEFWDAFFERYPIKELYTTYHQAVGYQEPFQGSDDGYPLSFHTASLSKIGFEHVTVFWKCGLRAVYGGTKPHQEQR